MVWCGFHNFLWSRHWFQDSHLAQSRTLWNSKGPLTATLGHQALIPYLTQLFTNYITCPCPTYMCGVVRYIAYVTYLSERDIWNTHFYRYRKKVTFAHNSNWRPTRETRIRACHLPSSPTLFCWVFLPCTYSSIWCHKTTLHLNQMKTHAGNPGIGSSHSLNRSCVELVWGLCKFIRYLLFFCFLF